MQWKDAIILRICYQLSQHSLLWIKARIFRFLVSYVMSYVSARNSVRDLTIIACLRAYVDASTVMRIIMKTYLVCLYDLADTIPFQVRARTASDRMLLYRSNPANVRKFHFILNERKTERKGEKT